MSNDLKNIHPYLFRRVRLKGILFTLLGLSSVFGPYLDAFFHTERNSSGVSSYITGSIFLVLGLAVLATLYVDKIDYRWSRKVLLLCLMYALFWLFTLIFLLLEKHISTISVFILWGYLTYNLYLIAGDSAWEGARLVHEIQQGNDDGSS